MDNTIDTSLVNFVGTDPNSLAQATNDWSGTDKLTQLGYISLGYVVTWPVVGLILALYVRSATQDPNSKSSYAQMTFWLVGLALFFMWLLWFSMYAAQLHPQLLLLSKCNKAANEVCEH